MPLTTSVETELLADAELPGKLIVLDEATLSKELLTLLIALLTTLDELLEELLTLLSVLDVLLILLTALLDATELRALELLAPSLVLPLLPPQPAKITKLINAI